MPARGDLRAERAAEVGERQSDVLHLHGRALHRRLGRERVERRDRPVHVRGHLAQHSSAVRLGAHRQDRGAVVHRHRVGVGPKRLVVQLLRRRPRRSCAHDERHDHGADEEGE
jgi:hypothetical protein